MALHSRTQKVLSSWFTKFLIFLFFTFFFPISENWFYRVHSVRVSSNCRAPADSDLAEAFTRGEVFLVYSALAVKAEIARR